MSPDCHFNFACPRCACLLQATAAQCDRLATCPTCGGPLRVPRLNRNGDPEPLRPADSDYQDPTPMHAYAACGEQAPRIRFRADGTAEIECPRCAAQAPMTANMCPRCGAPFTLEAVTHAAPREGTVGVFALVLGALAVPLCILIVPGVLALGFGLVGWSRQGRRLPEGQVLVGLVLAVLALVLGVIMHL